MVSLKSFKLINEGETDDSNSVELDKEFAKSNHQQQGVFQHHYNRHQLPIFVSETTRDPLSVAAAGSLGVIALQDDNHESNNNNSLNNNNNRKNEYDNNRLKMTSSNQDSMTGNQHDTNFVMMGGSRKPQNSALVSVTLPQMNKDRSETAPTMSPAASSSSISIVVVRHDRHNQARLAHIESSSADFTHDESSVNNSLTDSVDGSQNLRTNMKISDSTPVTQSLMQTAVNGSNDKFMDSNEVFRSNLIAYAAPIKRTGRDPSDMDESRLSVNTESEHFEIVWSNLSYRIKPKWYKKFNVIDRVFSHFMPGQTVDNHSSATSTASSSAGMNDNQHQMHSSANTEAQTNVKTKSPLDPVEIFSNLNGTIKSGQMTAVLGPSGK